MEYLKADVFPFQRPKKVTKKPKVELYPIAKVEMYKHGKVESYWYEIRKPDGTEISFPSYQEAEDFQQENKL